VALRKIFSFDLLQPIAPRPSRPPLITIHRDCKDRGRRGGRRQEQRARYASTHTGDSEDGRDGRDGDIWSRRAIRRGAHTMGAVEWFYGGSDKRFPEFSKDAGT